MIIILLVILIVILLVIMRTMRLTVAAALLLISNGVTAFGAAAAPFVVDTKRLLDDVRILSSSQFEGRATGTPGSRAAGAFLQQRYAALGLQPFGAGYAQPFTFSADDTVKAGVNYVGLIKGAAAPERFIVVSAHYDHLGIKNGELYAGADDNASGVAAMLAVAAYFKIHPPAHSIVFAAFDGEEIGLRGARAFVATMPFPTEALALNLNFDMLGRSERNELFAAGTSYTPALAPLVAQAARRHAVKVRFGHDHAQAGAGSEEDWTDSSDHAPFHAAGVPFLYFGVEDHADYHRPGDTFAHIDQAFFEAVAQLLVDVAARADASLK